MPVLVAHYLKAAKPKASRQRIEQIEEQNFIPATSLPAAEFDALLASMGLPVPPRTQPPEAPTP